MKVHLLTYSPNNTPAEWCCSTSTARPSFLFVCWFHSASYLEPCSNALLEALASGLPTLYQDGSGHNELVLFPCIPWCEYQMDFPHVFWGALNPKPRVLPLPVDFRELTSWPLIHQSGMLRFTYRINLISAPPLFSVVTTLMSTSAFQESSSHTRHSLKQPELPGVYR